METVRVSKKNVDVPKPDVYEYHDYREFLKDWFEFRKKTEHGFSLRALARRAGIGASYLPMVLSGSRSLTTKALHKISNSLGLSESELSYLQLLRTVVETDLPEERLRALKRIQSFRAYEKLNPRDAEVYHYLTKWFYVAIREMANTNEFKADAAWIQERLKPRVSIPEIQDALKFLIENGYIEVDAEGHVNRRDKQLTCHEGVYRIALGQFHKDMLNLAGGSFENTPRKKRTISGYTVAITPDRYDKIKKLLDKTHKEISKIVYYTEKPKSGDVYHITMCAFPLSADSEQQEGKPESESGEEKQA